jgi:hypothetical protein
MKLPRVTTGRLMIAVAIVGLVFAGWELSKRAAILRSQAIQHRVKADWCIEAADDFLPWIARGTADRSELSRWNREEARVRKLGEDHLRLSTMYDHAARYPWLPVAPDPPEPTRP